MSVIYSGVDHSIPGNGGPDCVSFISNSQRLVETVFGVGVAMVQISWGFKRMELPKQFSFKPHSAVWRRVVLGILCVVFGAEIAFKLASSSVIYLMNPCHMVTFVQILLLMVEPSHWLVSLVFRVHVYSLTGAILALIFPVVNTRFMPYEVGTYYVQHSLILIIPVYLMSIGGAFSMDPVCDISWGMFSMGILLLYHFLPIQIIGLMTQVNLNNMICPSISDPFRGPYWRVFSVFHQSLAVPLFGKAYTIVVRLLLSDVPPTNRKPSPGVAKNGDVTSLANDFAANALRHRASLSLGRNGVICS